MSFPGVAAHRGQLPGHVRPGRRLAISSLLMVPALFVAYLAAYAVGEALQGALVLAEDEMLKEAGVWGVVAAVPLVALLVSPQIVGIVLGVRARRLGERRLGTTGVVVNAAIAALLLLTSAVQLVIA